jgi:hypothetical protein
LKQGRAHAALAALVLGCWTLPIFNNVGLLLAYAALFLPYFWLLHTRAQLDLRLLLGVALIARLGLVWHDPVLSDDLYRYVWEGRVFAAGFNPFVDAPASSALSSLRDAEIWPFINHPEIPTIYPPAAQLLFALNALWDGGLVSLRLLLVAVEFLGLGLAIKWLNPQKTALLVYALNPLVIVETAWSGHIDTVAVAFLVLALGLFEQKKPTSALFFGLSIATKFLGLIGLVLATFAPLRRGESIFSRVQNTVVAVAVVAALYVPFLPENPRDLFQGFGTYAATWRSNDGYFRVWADTTQATMRHSDEKTLVELDGLNALFLERGWTKSWQGQTLPNTTFADDQVAQFLGKILAAAAVGSVFLAALWVRRDPWDGFGWTMLTLLLVAPTVHPWYVVWLVPIAARRQGGWATASLAFSLFVLLGYLAWTSHRSGGPWQVPWWASTLEFGVVTVLALWTGYATTRRERVDGI